MSEAVDADDGALWAALADRVGQQLGLHFPPHRRADLQRGVAAAAKAFALPSAAACAGWLLAAPWTRHHTDVLVRHLAIGETYFFRDRAVFDALERHVLPPLLRARAPVRRLRIWSAGCSTGEEPYSIAMLLERALPDLDGWNVSILATDVDAQSLAKGARGVYGDWSFRGMTDGAWDAFFTPAARGRQIAPRIRRRVQFSYLNLVREPFPSVENGTHAMDIVFCRNVLMYFEAGRARQVLQQLAHSLRSDGWLFLNPVEVPHLQVPELVPVHVEGVIAHRRRRGAPGAAAPEPLAGVAPAGITVAAVNDRAPASEDEATAPDPRALLRMAQDCANRGELEQARTWCERAVAADKLDAHSHYLLASVLQELRLADEAAGALRRTLYLEPRHVLAHYALGQLARRQGRSQECARHLRNALDAINAWTPEEAARRFEGLDAARLADFIRAGLGREARP